MEFESPREFEQDLEEALLDDAEAKLYGEANNLAFRTMQHIAENLRQYGQEHDMHVEPVIEAMRVVDARKTSSGVHVTIDMPHEATDLFEFGTPPHPIEGNPLHWFDEETGDDVFVTHVDHPGMPESRAIRDTIHWLRAVVQRRDARGRFQ